MADPAQPDPALLAAFASRRDEAAFAQLVARHLDWVYATALRQLHGDTHLAQDAAQLVFTDLARQADKLSRHPALNGWLFTATRFATAKLIRREQRRRVREHTASEMHPVTSSPLAPPDWEQLRPVIDQALADLSPADRDAVLLRFFENRDYTAIGERLALAPNTVRMRVDRALDKLGAALSRRGISSTAAALASALAAQGLVAAPAGLATTIATTAVTGAATTAAVGGSLLTLFAMNKLSLGLTATLALGGTAALVVQNQSQAALRTEIARLESSLLVASASPAPSAAPVDTAAPAPSSASTSTEANRSLDRAYEDLAAQAETLQERLREIDRSFARAHAQAPLTGPVHNLRELDVKPRPTHQVPPSYPADLRARGETGQAVISFVVDPSGTPRDLSTVSTTHEAFANAALEAVAAWKFSPGEIAHQAVNTRIQVPIVFTISSEKIVPDAWF